MNFSAEQLTSIVRGYFPSRMEEYEEPGTPPWLARFHERWRHELARMERWEKFIDSLRSGLPGSGIGNITATFDSALRCGVYPRKNDGTFADNWIMVGCMSILAPVYTIYAARFDYDGKNRIGQQLLFDSFPPEQQVIADAIAKKLEATFEAHALPRPVADTPIPLCVEPRQPPETTLFHALFTSEPESIP